MRKLLAAIILACLTIAPAWAQGGPYASTVMGQIRRLPNGGRPQTKVVFPEIRKDWKTLKISLERSACFGDCPDYKVQISADGTVDYEGHRSVVISGKHHARIDPQMVRKLFNAFEKADFFWLFDDYAAPVTDLPSYKLQLSFGGRTKSVGDYAGPAIGMPKAVRELEEQVDAVAQTDRWVSGTAQTFAYLKSQRWNFRSPSRKNVALFNFAMESKDDAFFLQLLAAGMPVRNANGCRALKSAVSNRQLARVQALLMAGAPVEWLATKSGDDDCQPFLDAADQADPEILRLILARRPRVNTRDENGATAFLYTVNGSGSAEGMNVEPALRQLIAAGADPQVRENDGSGAYHNAHRFPKVTAALLRLGVKGIDLPNHEGRTPLMLASEPEVARLLLAAGANPYSKDKQGLTPLDYARKQAKSDASPNTKATLDVVTRWVAEHPQKTH